VAAVPLVPLSAASAMSPPVLLLASIICWIGGIDLSE
jgi:hypothetical protein